MSEKLLPGNQFAICTYNTAVDALVVTHARAIHPSSLLSVIMKLNSSLWPWRLRNIKDLFFVPSQLQMNIFISQSQSPPSLLAVPLCAASLSGLNLFAAALSLLMMPVFSLKLISIRDFLCKSSSPHQRPSFFSVFLFKTKPITGHSSG